MKDAGGKLTAMSQSISGVFAGDEVMKGSLASYTFEHMEIASYTMLIAAANAEGEAEVARVCVNRICAKRRRWGDWLKSHLAETTQMFLSRAAADSDAAKR
ncbi:DUF892 family protein [Mesorhizobium sp. B2-6-1]|uniref:DUF892 family protein n=1 Tax=unclassified Mesorhizobium TaxID=325217 RepID=UPI0032B17A6D